MKAAEFQKLHGKKKTLRKKSPQETNREMVQSFLTQCEAAYFPKPVTEYKFMPDRKFRIDFFFLYASINKYNGLLDEIKLAVEIEGGVWQQGRHTRGSGAVKDMEKYNELTFADIKLLRFTVKQVMDGTALKELHRIFAKHPFHF